MARWRCHRFVRSGQDHWRERIVYSGGGDVHEDAHGFDDGGVFRLPFIAAAVGTGSGSGEPGGSSYAREPGSSGSATGCGGSCHASFAIDASLACDSGVARCTCDAFRTGNSRGTGRSGVGTLARLGFNALGRWAGGGLL